MSNRNYASGGKIYSMHVKPVMVTATAQIGAVGAVTSIVGSMVQSITKVSTGIYIMTMQDKTNFSRLYHVQGTMMSPPSGLSGVSTIECQNAPNASVSATTMTLTVKLLDAAGALVDPASGSALNIMAIMSDSSVMINGE